MKFARWKLTKSAAADSADRARRPMRLRVRCQGNSITSRSASFPPGRRTRDRRIRSLIGIIGRSAVPLPHPPRFRFDSTPPAPADSPLPAPRRCSLSDRM